MLKIIYGIKINFPKKDKELLNMVFIAELDAVYTPTHFHSNKETGAAHNCGHYSQVAIALSLFKEFVMSNEYENLGCNLSFIFVPAEEFLDLEYRKNLKKEGKIKYFGGKPEAMNLGIFDEFDFCIAIHSMGVNVIPQEIEIGYMPFKQNRYLSEFVKEEFEKNSFIEEIITDRPISAAGDIGATLGIAREGELAYISEKYTLNSPWTFINGEINMCSFIC